MRRCCLRGGGNSDCPLTARCWRRRCGGRGRRRRRGAGRDGLEQALELDRLQLAVGSLSTDEIETLESAGTSQLTELSICQRPSFFPFNRREPVGHRNLSSTWR